MQPDGTSNLTKYKTGMFFENCCKIAETLYGDGGVIQAIGEVPLRSSLFLLASRSLAASHSPART